MALKLRRQAGVITDKNLRNRSCRCHRGPLGPGAGSFKRVLGATATQLLVIAVGELGDESRLNRNPPDRCTPIESPRESKTLGVRRPYNWPCDKSLRVRSPPATIRAALLIAEYFPTLCSIRAGNSDRLPYTKRYPLTVWTP